MCKLHYSIIHESPKVETTQMSINRWTDKLWYIHTTDRIYSVIKKQNKTKSTDAPENMDKSLEQAG